MRSFLSIASSSGDLMPRFSSTLGGTSFAWVGDDQSAPARPLVRRCCLLAKLGRKLTLFVAGRGKPEHAAAAVLAFGRRGCHDLIGLRRCTERLPTALRLALIDQRE